MAKQTYWLYTAKFASIKTNLFTQALLQRRDKGAWEEIRLLTSSENELPTEARLLPEQL